MACVACQRRHVNPPRTGCRFARHCQPPSRVRLGFMMEAFHTLMPYQIADMLHAMCLARVPYHHLTAVCCKIIHCMSLHNEFNAITCSCISYVRIVHLCMYTYSNQPATFVFICVRTRTNVHTVLRTQVHNLCTTD